MSSIATTSTCNQYEEITVIHKTTIFLTAHLNSDIKFSSEIFYLYMDFIKFTVKKGSLATRR